MVSPVGSNNARSETSRSGRRSKSNRDKTGQQQARRARGEASSSKGLPEEHSSSAAAASSSSSIDPTSHVPVLPVQENDDGMTTDSDATWDYGDSFLSSCGDPMESYSSCGMRSWPDPHASSILTIVTLVVE